MDNKLKRYKSSMPFPFSQAVEANGFLFLSGQVSMCSDGKPIYGTIAEQVDVIFDRIKTTLQDCGSSLDNIVKATVWLSDMKHFQTFNQAYESQFESGFPVRSTVISELAFGLDVEIEVQALAGTL
ncbi:RidA family protein [Vibrio sp. S4M6]|uniref:RidA family protein n=1 Tax=Vibrio sinus TaxID=2946865 RepID=UPI00202A0D64|nr:RidA family protein [Vibrio sinus]MCL9781774.1 RidA family protein [Vibrio sinus]